MGTGYRGTFVISWSQTTLDGAENAPRDALRVGASWAWDGGAIRVDGPDSILTLTAEPDAARRGAARSIRRLLGLTAVLPPRDTSDDPLLSDAGFTVTDGQRAFEVTVIETGPRTAPLLMCLNQIPPSGVDLWVVAVETGRRPAPPRADLTSLVEGTMIATPQGMRAVETLDEDDLVITRDHGAQPVAWIGKTHLAGAHLFNAPHLRPVRFDTSAFGAWHDRPLLVAPGQRVLVEGASALFNADEVMVSAADLLDWAPVARDLTLRSVTYIHVLLPRHGLIFANGVATESFHPTRTDLALMDDGDRMRLRAVCPEPARYGADIRRVLTPPEAAILLHRAA